MLIPHPFFRSLLVASLLTLCLFPSALQAHDDLAPEAALEKLLAGNERFTKGLSIEKRYSTERPSLIHEQHPYAIILTCADSRVAPEAIFDESLGKLFVVRVEGNVSDPVILGSIEYAAQYLHASLLVVLGHEHCSAVKAAVANQPVSPNLAKIIQRLRPAVEKARVYGRDENEVVAAAIKENVRYQMKMITFESDVLGELVQENKLNIVGGIYNLNTGKVEFMRGRETSPEVKAQVSPPQPASKSPTAVPTSTSPVKALVAPTPQPKRPEAAKPAKKAPSAPAKDASGHDDEEANLSSPSSNAAPAARKAVTFDSLAFADKLRAAFENQYEVALKTATLLRDSHDRCLSADCRSLPAGEIVTLDSPHILSVLGRPSVRVRHGKQRFYVPAEEKNFAFSEVPAEPAKTLVGQMLTAPTKFKNAFSPTTKR